MERKEAAPVNARRAPDVAGMLATALMAALIAAGAQIAIPLPLVPVNLALLAVLLTGLVLPRRQAIAAVLLYLLMGALGLPVFSGFRGGPQALFGPGGGYLIGYLFAAGTVSSLRDRARSFTGRLLLCALAVLACYIPGALWLGFLTGKPLPETLSFGVLPFLPGDLLKSLAADGVADAVMLALLFSDGAVGK